MQFMTKLGISNNVFNTCKLPCLCKAVIHDPSTPQILGPHLMEVNWPIWKRHPVQLSTQMSYYAFQSSIKVEQLSKDANLAPKSDMWRFKTNWLQSIIQVDECTVIIKRKLKGWITKWTTNYPLIKRHVRVYTASR